MPEVATAGAGKPTALDASPTTHPTWLDNRRLVKLGSVRIDHIAPDPEATDKATMFTPLDMPDGIEPADPMLGLRQAAYPLSFQHRQ